MEVQEDAFYFASSSDEEVSAASAASEEARRLAERAANAVAEGRGGVVRSCSAAETDERLRAVLRRTTRASTSYSAARFPAGYHTWRLPQQHSTVPTVVRGERDPLTRLAALSRLSDDDFSLGAGTSILDIGCNQGAMLIEASIAAGCSGIGVDFDSELINAANRMARHFTVNDRCVFYTFDVDVAADEVATSSVESLAGPGGEETAAGFRGLDRMHTFLETAGGVSIIFLLAVCQWVRRWEELLHWCRRTAPALLFEDNGNREQQAQHQALLRKLYPRIDDLGCRVRGRRLLLCRVE